MCLTFSINIINRMKQFKVQVKKTECQKLQYNLQLKTKFPNYIVINRLSYKHYIITELNY